VYDKKCWWFAEDHSRLAIARLSVKIGNVKQAVEHYISMVSSSRQPLQRQKSNMKELQDIIINFSKLEEFLLDVPKFDQDNIEVIFNDRHTLPPSSAANVWINGETTLFDHFSPTAPQQPFQE
jgi:hypothetical protein